MDNLTLKLKIESGRDYYGVINATTFNNELTSLTPADWRQAAALYPKSGASNDGFYIEDKNGAVTIHNDTRSAQQATNDNAWQATVKDMEKEKDDAVQYLKIDVPIAGMVGAAGGAAVGVGGATIGTAALVGAGAGVAVAAGVFAVYGLGALGIDYAANSLGMAQATDDVRNQQTLSFNPANKKGSPYGVF